MNLTLVNLLTVTSDVNPTPADDNDSQPRSCNPTPVDKASQPSSRPVLNLRRVSPPQFEEVHRKFFLSHFVFFFTSKLVDTAMDLKKIDLRSISPPPPNFNMQMIQKELTRLARVQTGFDEKLREHKAEADAVEELFIHAQHSIQRHEVDPSALIDGLPTLTLRLAALEDVTQRLQQDDLASRAVLEKVKELETSVWFQQGETNSAHGRMDRLEECNRELWRGQQDRIDVQQRELGSIRIEHQRFEAEMKETVRALEKKSQLTPAALEERLTGSLGKLTTRMEEVEQSLMAMLKSVTTVSEQQLKLTSRQSTLEQVVIQHLGKKVRNAEIDATKETGDIGTDMMDRTKSTVDIGTNTTQPQTTGQVQGSKSPVPFLLAPNPVVAARARSASPLPIGSRKSPRLLEKDAVPPASSKSSACNQSGVHLNSSSRYYQ